MTRAVAKSTLSSQERVHLFEQRVSEVTRKGACLEADFERLRGRVHDVIALRLYHGYQLGVKTLEQFGFLEEKVAIPSLGEIIERYDDKDLALLQDYQKPSIVIRPPGKDCRDMIRTLARHDATAVRNGPVVQEGQAIKWGVDMEYRPFIVEAVSNIQPKGDLLSQDLGGRMWRHREKAAAGEYAMTSEIYMLLAMQSMVRGQMIDRKTFTILNGEPVVADRYVPIGRCLEGQVSLDWIPCDSREAVRGRFRRVLSGGRR